MFMFHNATFQSHINHKIIHSLATQYSNAGITSTHTMANNAACLCCILLSLCFQVTMSMDKSGLTSALGMSHAQKVSTTVTAIAAVAVSAAAAATAGHYVASCVNNCASVLLIVCVRMCMRQCMPVY
jgi:hypothetical protein